MTLPCRKTKAPQQLAHAVVVFPAYVFAAIRRLLCYQQLLCLNVMYTLTKLNKRIYKINHLPGREEGRLQQGRRSRRGGALGLSSRAAARCTQTGDAGRRATRHSRLVVCCPTRNKQGRLHVAHKNGNERRIPGLGRSTKEGWNPYLCLCLCRLERVTTILAKIMWDTLDE